MESTNKGEKMVEVGLCNAKAKRSSWTQIWERTVHFRMHLNYFQIFHRQHIHQEKNPQLIFNEHKHSLKPSDSLVSFVNSQTITKIFQMQLSDTVLQTKTVSDLPKNVVA